MTPLPLDTKSVIEICRRNDEGAISPYLRPRILHDLKVIYEAG